MQPTGPQLRETIMAAMLHACGRWGYRGVTVQRLLDAYGGNRAQLYRQFDNLEACYLEAYETEARRICAEILNAGAGGENWRDGLGAALEALAVFLIERPTTARGLLIEVHLAGEPALAKRRELLDRLAKAIDSARRESGSRHPPPPRTDLFMVSAIEAAAVAALGAGEPQHFREIVPELAGIAGAAYFGD